MGMDNIVYEHVLEKRSQLPFAIEIRDDREIVVRVRCLNGFWGSRDECLQG